jgi:hypothetical protein
MPFLAYKRNNELGHIAVQGAARDTMMHEIREASWGLLPKSFWRRRSVADSAAACSTTSKSAEIRAFIWQSWLLRVGGAATRHRGQCEAKVSQTAASSVHQHQPLIPKIRPFIPKSLYGKSFHQAPIVSRFIAITALFL